MSYRFTAYVTNERFPSVASLVTCAEHVGARIELPGLKDLRTSNGLLIVVLDGTPTSFELYCSDITDTDRDEYRHRLELNGEAADEFLEVLTACDVAVGISCKTSDRREIAAGRIVANAVAAAAGGWFCDPQTDETVRYASR